jgi:hypothetical protein
MSRGETYTSIRTPASVGTISQTLPVEPTAAGNVPICCSQPKADIVIDFDLTRAHLAGVTTRQPGKFMSPTHLEGASSRLQATALPAAFFINSKGRWHAAITAARRCVLQPLPA